ncbi:MAG: XRE family transcriptional regulator [Bacteroidetes bacterium]|nr:MAG: XRE family transcriptional regulator [Bacteroidota bacterium]
MRRRKVKVTVLKEDIGYSAIALIGDDFVGTEADTFEELKTNIIEALNFAYEELEIEYTLSDIQFEFDLESFFDFYKVINAKALSERIGMNQSLLAQYIKGIKKPSPAQTKRILNGVQQIGRELTEVRFLL